MLTPLSQRRAPDFAAEQNFIDGQSVLGQGESLAIPFPVTGETLANLACASLEQVDEAVLLARQRFDEGVWRSLPAEQRARALERTAQLLMERKDQLVRRILFDNGKTCGEAEIDVLAAVGSCHRSAADCRSQKPLVLAEENGLQRTVHREPVGVVAGITPFNAPLMFAGLKAAPALAAGNSVVLKPSERAPFLARAFCDAAHEAGIPPGVLGLVQGGTEVAAHLCGHDGVDMITITGGSRAGSAVMRSAAPTIKNLLLELGGKSAHIVLADADLETAIPAVAAGIFRNAGQRCFSGSRLVVQRQVAEQVEQGVLELASSLVVGDPFEEGTQIGPMIDQRAVEDAESFVRQGQAEGLALGCGGQRIANLWPGSFFPPTVLLGAKATSRAAQEEVFGPVLTVIRVEDADEAVQVANQSRYGLAGGVWSSDLAKAQKVAHAVRSGYFWINTYGAIAGDVPFGGYGHSGLGREAGIWGYEAYTELKSVLRDTTGGRTAPMF